MGDLPLTLLANFRFFAEIVLSTFERLCGQVHLMCTLRNKWSA